MAACGVTVCSNSSLEFNGLERRSHVVGIGAVVFRSIHEAIALIRVVDGADGAVAGQVLVVDTEAIPGRVGIGKHAGLKDFWLQLVTRNS